MRHMTPYRDTLVNYVTIAPMPINAEYQHTFHAIGQGDLPIHVPNASRFTKITLKDILHTPDITLTLISISLINQASYSITFNDGMCTICDSGHKLFGHFL